MKFMDNQEVQKWIRDRGISLTSDGYPYYNLEQLHCLSIKLDIRRPENLIGLASRLVLMAHDYEFHGALLWVTMRGAWADYSEKTGAKMIELMRRGGGEASEVEGRPGHLFGSAEYYELQSYLLLPLLFGWDAFVIPEGEDYFVFVNHDSVVGVVSKTAKVQESRRKYLASWQPVEADWYRKFYVE